MAKTKRLTNKDDNFTGTTGDDHVLGLNGNDKINGGKGADILVGGNGNDTLNGGADNDTLKGNAGDDKLLGASGDDRINGGAGNDNMQGGAGDDVITATSGNDKVDGGEGDDKVVLKGNFDDAVISEVNNGFKIELGGNTITVKNVENFKFSDGTQTKQQIIDSITNHDPSAVATQNLSGTEDTAVTGAVGATDSDGDTLTYSVPATGSTDGPAHGSVTVDASGNFTYTPTANYNGTDSFVVTVSDGEGGSTKQTVNITLAAANDSPTADATQAVSGTEDTAVTGTVVAADIDGDTLTYSVPATGDTNGPAHGSVTIDASGNFTYTPVADYNGTDTFTVTISDGHGGTTQQVVTVTLDPTEDAPTAAATQDVSGDEDTAITGSIGATDVDNDTLTYTVPATGDTDGPAHGTVTIDADGNYTYTPVADFNGTDSFVVTIDDGNGGTTTQTINVTVDAVNDAPVVTGVADVQITDGAEPLFSSFAVSDAEGNFGAGTVLTVTSDGFNDKFSIINTAGGVTTAANVVLFNGVGIGTFDTDVNGQLIITFNANATKADIEAVGQAITVSAYDSHNDSFTNGGTPTLTVTLTDSDGATSEPLTSHVVSVATTNGVDIDDLNNDSQVAGVADPAAVVDVGHDANVDYVTSVGLGNVDDVKLTIALGGGSDPTDILTIPTALNGNGTIANIAGNLVYQDSTGTQYNVGTVTQTGTTITISLTNDVGSAINLAATDFDNILGLVIRSTTVDAGANDGVRDVTFTIDGVGDISATATAHLVVTDGGKIELTADSDATTVGNQGDTNATLGTIDAAGINVFNAEAGTLQTADNFSGGSTVNDILTAVLTGGTSVAPTIAAVETFNLTTDGTAGAAVLDALHITNTNDMTIKISDAGGVVAVNDVTVNNIGSTFTTVDASDSTGTIVLTTQDGHSLDVTTGSGATSITAQDSVSVQAAITVDASNGAALTLSGSADFSIEGSTTNSVNAASTTDSLTVESVDDSLTLTTGAGAVTVSDIDAAATLTVAAGSMADDTLLKVSGEGDVLVTGGFIGSLDASGLSGDLKVTLGDDENPVEEGTSVILGSGANQTILGAGSDDTVTVNAAAAVTYDPDSNPVTDNDANVNVVISGVGTYVLNNVTADVDASAATGSVTVNAVAGADISVTAGTQTAIMGTADDVSIAASISSNTITIGTLADDFAGNVDVTGLVNGTLDASHLTGELTVDAASIVASSSSIVLGAGVSSFDLTADGTTTVNASGFTGAFSLDGSSSGAVAVSNAGSITIDADGALPANTDDFAGSLTVAMVANASTTIVSGTGSVTVSSGDADSNADLDTLLDGTRSTVTVNASELSSGHSLTLNDSLSGVGGFNLNVSVTGLGSGTTVDLSGSNEVDSTATTTLATATLASGTVTAVLGSSQTVDISSSSLTASAGTVSINATAAIAGDFDHNGLTAATNAQITLSGSSAYVLTGVSADVHASAASGGVEITALTGTTNALSLTTGDGVDNITGGDGADTIVAGKGDDTLDGGAGLDKLTGGDGNDTFVFNATETGNTIGSADHVTDFVINEDVIDLQDYALTGVDDAAKFAHLTISVGSNSTVITIDNANHDKIVLDGDYTGQNFTADQFVF